MSKRHGGFSLLELLLALAVALTLVSVIGKALLGELGQSGRLAWILRERAVTQRALELMRMELQEAHKVRVMPGPIGLPEGCGLAGREVLLQLNFKMNAARPDRYVTYSLERYPDPIWRGQTLMRCGPAYGLNGQMEDSTAVSRVWLDSLDASGSQVESFQDGTVRLTLIQVYSSVPDRVYSMRFRMTAPSPGLTP